MLLILKLKFNIIYYSAIFVLLHAMAQLLETFGNKHMEETALLDWAGS